MRHPFAGPGYSSVAGDPATPNMYVIVSCLLAILAFSSTARAQDAGSLLGPGDLVKITVFRNPDLTTETRVSENGTLTFPLIGLVPVQRANTTDVERRIAQMLRSGGYVAEPQVNVTVLEFRSAQIAVLGQVNRPGRYPLEGAPRKITDLLATAGGITQQGADAITVVIWREGKERHVDIDLSEMFESRKMIDDIRLSGGDVIYVPRAPVFYIYGEVQKAGQYRLERDMTVLQTLAAGGGLTNRATQRGIRLHRRGPNGTTIELSPQLNDRIRPDDVIFVRESLF